MKISLRPDGESASDVGLVGIHLRIFSHDLRRGLNAVQIRHGDIHNNDVRTKFFGHPHRFPALGGFTHDLEIAVLLKLEGTPLRTIP
jgi:hypothetical protein